MKHFLVDGFTNGFEIPLKGILEFRVCRNLLSAIQLPHSLNRKIIALIVARLVGPFHKPSFEPLKVGTET